VYAIEGFHAATPAHDPDAGGVLEGGVEDEGGVDVGAGVVEPPLPILFLMLSHLLLG
jgi:hypothetical protein